MTLLRKRYRIVAPIGEGGMGSVFLADDLRLPGRQCALKRILVAPAGDRDASARLAAQLAHEATVLARLDHPALPKVSDFFEAEGTPWLVMDYVVGQDLRAIAADARNHGRVLDEAQVVHWAEELCACLTYLHGQAPPVVHRDIKPANVKLTPDGQVRLVDFGMAQAAADGESATVTTVTGGGSRPYQALEQYGPSSVPDPRSDIYALGATLYHLLTGRAPASAQERFLDESRLVPPRAIRPDLSPRVERVVLAALALHPDGRPATAEDLRRRLLAPSEGAPDGRALDRALRGNGWLLAFVVTLFLAALALTLWP